MDFKKKSWTNLINMVKLNPVIYVKYSQLTRLVPTMTQSQYNDTLDSAWRDIAKKLKLPSKKCKNKWWVIKTRYAKLNKLILSGKVSKHVIRSHPSTNNLMEGILSFLDPHIKDFSDDDIPLSVHEDYNNLFCSKTLDKNPNNTSLAHQNSIEPVKVVDRIKLELESELIIDDHIKSEIDDEEIVEDSPTEIKESPGIEDYIEMPKIEDIVTPKIEDIDNPKIEDMETPEIENIESPEINIIQFPTIDHQPYPLPLQHILPHNLIGISDVNYGALDNTIIETSMPSVVDENIMAYKPVTYVTDNEMINFFEELAKTVSTELSKEKQKKLQERINALIIKEKILEGD